MSEHEDVPTEGVSELSFLPMQAVDLEAVLAIEAVSHLHPWTRGNFADSLAAGHWAYCIRPQVDQAIKGSFLDPDVLWAYCILFPAVDELHLLNITVSPKLRKLGLGARMMAAIEGVAAQQNIPRILLEVRPTNTGALNLYQKLGYEQIGIRKNYYPANEQTGAREDALVMAKSIKLG
ncbi:ribosomal protein S18-alanine N-acetyltransferase [Polynucleobacter sp. AP-Latsch-80-C2]|jgi:ribosomal-protein-alanine N-acetyltransferase|uniref:ribosomal protein S18-alanine N-acetyltransferase n=1 Tax=Polynucleobacter sp. AP-Latsch-80-C2 TaxID=2576931 RepID=UPI001C0ACC1F|nr:ribosomal protein S18-alanine N-acetyltransferase [Polynucleobacter sp. AP-Latsch-80-C2]MBU3624083.1 ribosomal protein S18-alanine N-acetyltransferase [Polynucleobacter sp. AP-Latsch-80-C2]